MTKKFNILHLRSSGGLYGAEGVILNLSRELNNLGLNNYIVCIDNSKNSHTELTTEAKKFNISAGNIICTGRFELGAIVKIRQLLKKYNIHILHCHDYKANLFGFLASRFLNIRLIATNHLWTKETFVLRLYEVLDGLVLNFFHKVVAVSEQIKQESKKYLLLSKNKLITIYNGIDLTAYTNSKNGKVARRNFNIKPETKIIGSVGRLSIQKGFDYLLEAAKDVLVSIPDTVFLIAGDGLLGNYLKEKAKKLGIEEKIIFTGARNDIIDIYSCMDVFVLPSIREGLPLVVLEALAMKKPVIATNVGGVAEVVKPNKTGILLPPKNTQRLSEAIIDLLRNKDKADCLAENGSKLVKEQFSSKTMAEKYQIVYENLLNR